MRIRKETISEIEINKSKFICYLSRVESEDDAKEYIKTIKRLHPKATHHCQAFIINSDIQRSNDDGEPSGTAGVPMLEVLRHKDMELICAVVVRYYGGIQLGSKGLVRAYTRSVSTALEQAVLYQTILTKQYRLSVDYAGANKIESILQKADQIETDYGLLVNITYCTQEEDFNTKIVEALNGRYLPEYLNDLEIERPLNNTAHSQ